MHPTCLVVLIGVLSQFLLMKLNASKYTAVQIQQPTVLTHFWGSSKSTRALPFRLQACLCKFKKAITASTIDPFVGVEAVKICSGVLWPVSKVTMDSTTELTATEKTALTFEPTFKKRLLNPSFFWLEPIKVSLGSVAPTPLPTPFAMITIQAHLHTSNLRIWWAMAKSGVFLLL